MEKNFNKILDLLLKSEGGFVNSKFDRGGPTNYGITKKTYEDFLGHEVSIDDIKNMNINDAKLIYKKNYWNKIEGDNLPSGIDFCVFDFAVNSSVSTSAKYLQRIVNTIDDGIIGANTLIQTNKLINKIGVVTVINLFQEKRRNFLYKITQEYLSQKRYLKGWLERVDRVEKDAKLLI